MRKILIVATDENNGIGKEGSIPWENKKDKRFFREVTTEEPNNLLICGRLTYETMKKMVMLNREFCVITKEDIPGVKTARSIEEALKNTEHTYDNVFFVGGESIYEESQYIVDEMIITRIEGDYECDKKFKPDYDMFELVKERDEMFYYYEPLHPDKTYKRLCRTILREGEEKEDRTNTGTLSKFGCHIKFNLGTYLPVLTTKKVYLKGIIKELLWFLKGGTDSKELEKDGVNIWKGNTSKEYLEKIGLEDYEEGECGPIYGYQWRKWNAPYKKEGSGIDQIEEIVRLIKEEPTSRRMILTAWNPEQLKEMALPPCHIMCQFYVSSGKLHCHMYQRSADVFLGLPFNITSYAILTHLIARTTEKEVGNLYISLGDAHIYKDHIEQIKMQIKREEYTCPKIKIDAKETLQEYEYEDIKIINYESHGAIKGNMAV